MTLHISKARYGLEQYGCDTTAAGDRVTLLGTAHLYLALLSPVTRVYTCMYIPDDANQDSRTCDVTSLFCNN